MTMRSTRLSLLCLIAAATLGLGGCTFDPAAIPVPGAGVAGPAYRIHIEFASALNLPARAEVTADGVRVGTLSNARIVHGADGRPGHVVADVDIAAAVHLSHATTARLRQDTVLGDVYIALTDPDGGSGTALTDGATIPLDHTVHATQIEDTMAGLATFLRGGAITRLQDIVNQVNAALPTDPRDTARIAETIAGDLGDVAAHLDVISEFAAAADSDIDVIRANATTIRELWSAEGARRVTEATASLAHLLGIFSSIAELAHAVTWLTPLAEAGDAAAAAVLPLFSAANPLDLSAPSNLNRFVALLHERVLPLASQGGAVNIVDIRTSTEAQPVSSAERDAALITILRMAGVVR
ncbi:MlaD family protein [Nocardia brasiliensis]|uniref:MlaD family protein n=1 Tax=Nocardia brasiliensis TaxID=37326 RepID=UPI0033FBBF31